MIEHQFGRVINLTGTREPRSLNAAHAAKAAGHVWSKGLSKVVAKDGVTVDHNGSFDTDIDVIVFISFK